MSEHDFEELLRQLEEQEADEEDLTDYADEFSQLVRRRGEA